MLYIKVKILFTTLRPDLEKNLPLHGKFHNLSPNTLSHVSKKQFFLKETHQI